MSDYYTITDFLKNDEVSISEVRGSNRIPMHSHEFIEMIYICEGEVTHSYKGENTKLKKSGYIFIDYNQPHCLTEKSEDLCIIRCLFIPEFIDSALKNNYTFSDVLSNYLIGISPLTINSHKIFFDKNDEIKNELQHMLSEFENKEIGYTQIMRSCLIKILVLSMRNLNAQNRNFGAITRRMIEYANKNFHKRKCLGELSSELNYSCSKLSNLFKNEVGITYTRYIQQTRIRVSCHLLLQTNMSVEQIAERVGYSDVRAYRKNFKSIMEITPLKYRLSARKAPL